MNIPPVLQESQAGRGEEGRSWGLSGLEGKHLLDMVTKLGAFCYRLGPLGVLRSETGSVCVVCVLCVCVECVLCV